MRVLVMAQNTDRPRAEPRSQGQGSQTPFDCSSSTIGEDDFLNLHVSYQHWEELKAAYGEVFFFFFTMSRKCHVRKEQESCLQMYVSWAGEMAYKEPASLGV